jgi:hypothetical protein
MHRMYEMHLKLCGMQHGSYSPLSVAEAIRVHSLSDVNWHLHAGSLGPETRELSCAEDTKTCE